MVSIGSGGAVRAAEHELVVRPGQLLVLQLGLGDRRPHVDVPQRRRLGSVGEVAVRRGAGTRAATCAWPWSRSWCRCGPSRPTGPTFDQRSWYSASNCGHDLLAQLDEVRPADRDRPGLRVDLLGALEVGVVGEGGVDDGAGDELDAALDVEAVVVPAHRVEDLLAAHALVAGDEVGVRVAEDVPGVQRAAHRGRRRVDGEDLGAGLRAVEPVGAVGLPAGAPLRLQPLERRLLRDRRHGRQGTGAPGLRPEVRYARGYRRCTTCRDLGDRWSRRPAARPDAAGARAAGAVARPAPPLPPDASRDADQGRSPSGTSSCSPGGRTASGSSATPR